MPSPCGNLSPTPKLSYKAETYHNKAETSNNEAETYYNKATQILIPR